MNKKVSTTIGIIIIVAAAIATIGILAWQEGWLGQLVATSTPTPTPDETADWKTYRNEKYGFEIKYPPEYSYATTSAAPGHNETKEILMFTRKENPYYPAIQISVKDGKDSLTEWFDNLVANYYENHYSFFEKGCLSNCTSEGDDCNRCINKVSKGITIGNNIPALQYIESGRSGIYINLLTKKNEDANWAVLINRHEISISKDVWERMLSTFRFVESTQNETADWKICRNDEYGFEIKYPQAYSLSNRVVCQRGSRLFLIEKASDADLRELSIEVISPNAEDKIVYHLGMSDIDYLNYIQNPEHYSRADTLIIGDRRLPVFFFLGENPGALGDFRDTVIVIIEHEGTTFVLKDAPALEVSAEFS